jgi:hypothetical protein
MSRDLFTPIAIGAWLALAGAGIGLGWWATSAPPSPMVVPVEAPELPTPMVSTPSSEVPDGE